MKAATTKVGVVAALSLVFSVRLRGASVSVVAALVGVLLLGASLVSHPCHELLDDVGNLVHVSGADWAMTTFLEMTLEVLLFLFFLFFKVTVRF